MEGKSLSGTNCDSFAEFSLKFLRQVLLDEKLNSKAVVVLKNGL